MKPRIVHRGASLLVLCAAIAAACGSPSPTPGPTAQPTASPASTASPGASSTSSATPTSTPAASPDLTLYPRIEAQVEQLRQLSPKSTVAPILLDEKGVRDWMTKAFQKSVDHKAMAAQSRLFIHMGLLPAGASLEQLELDLNSGQVIGFYDTDTKQLYLLSQSGAVGPEQQFTFSHEFTHALQDQNFGLDKLAIDTVDQGDRDLARTALPEGDASLSMTQWAQAHMSLADLLSISLSSASGPAADQLNNAPAILREDLLFPYVDGLAFIQGIYIKGGWAAVDKLYSNPPNSTAQILHPALYAAGVNPIPQKLPAVPAALGSGWTLSMQDTMGELQLRIWLEGAGTDAQKKAASSAVSSWGGDRIGLYEGPNGAWAVVLKTQWRSTGGRTAFAAGATAILEGINGPSVVCGDATHADVVIASDQTGLGAFATCKIGE